MALVIKLGRDRLGMPRMALLCAGIALMASAAFARRGDETLASGVAAYQAERIDTALPLLARELSNPYLEAFRLFYRAESFSRDSLYREAASAFEGVLALSRDKRIVERHPLVALAREGYMEAALKNGSCFALNEVPFDLETLSAHSLLALSSACFERGMHEDAIAFFIRGARGRPAPADSTRYRELMQNCRPLSGELPHDALISVAKGATSLRLFREADSLLDSLIARNRNDYPALLCKATLLSQAREPRRALHALWRIFYSPAPVEAKQEALDEIAHIEYRLKRYDKAFEHYRMFGLYYPHDARAAAALDTAARIAVLRGETEEALGIWSLLRKRNNTDALSSEAALSEGVLRYSRGEKEEANMIFRTLLSRTNGTMIPSVLYWLARTSPSEAERAMWTDSLARAFPRSFYARIIRGEEEFLFSREANAPVSDISAIERYEKSILDSIARLIAPDDSLLMNPAYEAYRYLLESGLLEEAEKTAYALMDAIGPSDRRLLAIYRCAISNGLIHCSFSILNRAAACERTVALPWELWYPAPYSDAIQEQAAAYGLPADLLLAVIREESKFDSLAVSPDGARGLMQLLPSTASWLADRSDSVGFSPENLFESSLNIKLGAGYLAYLMRRFNGSTIGALAAYNGGEGRMAQWRENFDPVDMPLIALEMIGPRETRLYAKKVLDAFSAYRTIAEKARFE
jgi:soluble lytic murein transglycosylase